MFLYSLLFQVNEDVLLLTKIRLYVVPDVQVRQQTTMLKSNVHVWALLLADLKLHFANVKANSHDATTKVTVNDAGNCSLAMITWVVNDNKIISGLVVGCCAV